MRVLLLSPYGTAIAQTIRNHHDQAIIGGEYADPTEWPSVDFIVMFGHRKIIREPILSRYRGRLINIHGSYLPWNRGAYPNLFSWVTGTPKGASIHYVSDSIDAGSIIVRQCVDFSQAPNTTLASSYDAIKIACEDLFDRAWAHIRLGANSIKQDPNEGSFHTIKEGDAIIKTLPQGWNTPVKDLPHV